MGWPGLYLFDNIDQLGSVCFGTKDKNSKLVGSNIWMVPDDMVKQLGILLALQGTALDY